MMVFCLSLCQVTRPDGKPETLGLVVLDEPIAKQSDPTGTVRKQRLFMRQQYIHNNTTTKVLVTKQTQTLLALSRLT